MLQVHYFENFKGAPTLLLAGARPDIERLLGIFRTWTGKRVDVAESLGQDIGIQLDGMSKLVLDRSLAGPSSVAEMIGDICEWRVSDSWQERVAGLLQGLAESESTAHQYLDSGETSVQILCSNNEY